jgi:hypothetical protein
MTTKHQCFYINQYRTYATWLRQINKYIFFLSETIMKTNNTTINDSDFRRREDGCETH